VTALRSSDGPGPAGLALTLDEVRRAAGDGWDITKIPGGYRATAKTGATPVPRYGRTPGELLESIQQTEHQP
jgi:hypothetical protein